MKNSELKYIKELVFEELTKSKEARNSDQVLYVRVARRMCPELMKAPFGDVLLNAVGTKKLLPPFESVRRYRAKMQELYPELKAENNVKSMRTSTKHDYIYIAKSK